MATPIPTAVVPKLHLVRGRYHGKTIEQAFSKLKALLRKAAERTVAGLWTAVGGLLDAFTPAECANYFAAAGALPHLKCARTLCRCLI